MTFIELICALIIFGFFISGFSQVFLPVYKTWERAVKTYQTAKDIKFIKESYKIECAKHDRNIDRWRKNVSTVKEPDNFEVYEYWQNDLLRALKLTFYISGEKIEIIGLCSVEKTPALVYGSIP
ncbi:MAG: hypothetical protein FWC03_04155 [Treponema sp.]|nr:hypothetical protein [Treponema sp.]